MQKFMTNLEKFTKITSVVCGTLLILHSLQIIFYLSIFQMKHFVLSCSYVLMAGFLIISEFHMEIVKRNLKLIDNTSGRGIYMFFMGTLLITEPTNTVSFLLSLLFMIMGAIYIILGLVHDKNTINREKLVEYVQKDEEAQNDSNTPPVPNIKV